MISQNIPFQWPLDQLSLYSGIYDYLKHSGVSTAISMEIEHFLMDTRNSWRNGRRSRAEGTKSSPKSRNASVSAEAERRLQDAHSQPVIWYFNSDSEDGDNPNQFYLRLQSLFLFNAFVAVCENKHRFKTNYLASADVQTMLRSSDLGPAVNVLSTYVERIEKARAARLELNIRGSEAELRAITDVEKSIFATGATTGRLEIGNPAPGGWRCKLQPSFRTLQLPGFGRSLIPARISLFSSKSPSSRIQTIHSLPHSS